MNRGAFIGRRRAAEACFFPPSSLDRKFRNSLSRMGLKPHRRAAPQTFPGKGDVQHCDPTDSNCVQANEVFMGRAFVGGALFE